MALSEESRAGSVSTQRLPPQQDPRFAETSESRIQ